MKTYKAPEKIVLQEPTKVRTERLYDNDIEYVQTDAFIEKAVEWWEKEFNIMNMQFQDSRDFYRKKLDNFKKAMEV